MTLHPFVSEVASLRFENSFNPYSDRCDICDRSDAPSARASALSSIVERAAASAIDSIWVGRDLGYRGGRRTGLALTDDVHVEHHARRWDCVVDRPTVGAAVAERTASVIWGVLNQIEAKVFLWNVFPLHPHEAGAPFTNRQHNAQERRAGEEVLEILIRLLQPRRVVAVGNDAARAAERVSNSVPVVAVRHPSYGGQATFLRQINELYNLRPRDRLL